MTWSEQVHEGMVVYRRLVQHVYQGPRDLARKTIDAVPWERVVWKTSHGGPQPDLRRFMRSP